MPISPYDGYTARSNWIRANQPVVVTDIAALRLLDKTKIGYAITKGYYAAGDGGAGEYWYDSSDTTSTDNSGTVIKANDNGIWKLSTSYVNVRQFGARGNGATDDTSAILAAANSLTQGGVLFFPPGRYLVSSLIDVFDKTAVKGSGIGATTLLSTASNNSGVFRSWDSSQGNLYTGQVTRSSFCVSDLSIDMGHTLDRTSTVTTFSDGSYYFNQWFNYGASCIIAANTQDVVIENVRLTNAGFGINTGSNTNLFIRNVDIQGMQWDGIQTQITLEVMSIKNARIHSTGRNGIISMYDIAQISIEDFSISDCYCEGIEVEQPTWSTTIEHPVIRNGYITQCGTFIQIESYGIQGYSTVENIFLSTPLTAAVAGASFGNKTIGYADQYYNLNTGSGWTGSPAFPVPNVAGTWGNMAGAGVRGQVPTVFRNCVFMNMSTVAITNVAGPVYAYAFYETTDSSDTIFANCRFISSNVFANNGEQRQFTDNVFIGSWLTVGQASESYSQSPSTTISGNLFTGPLSGLVLSDNAVVSNNIFRNVSGVAVTINTPADGRTVIEQNTIIDARGGSALMTTGISCAYQSPSNCLIQNNYIVGALTNGILLYDSTANIGFSVSGNRIESCGVGIFLNRGNSDVIQNNTLRNNTTADIVLYGSSSSPAGTAVRIINNLLQSTVAIKADSYSSLPGSCRFCNNEFTALSPTNLFSWGGSNVVQGNWN